MMNQANERQSDVSWIQCEQKEIEETQSEPVPRDITIDPVAPSP